MSLTHKTTSQLQAMIEAARAKEQDAKVKLYRDGNPAFRRQ